MESDPDTRMEQSRISKLQSIIFATRIRHGQELQNEYLQSINKLVLNSYHQLQQLTDSDSFEAQYIKQLKQLVKTIYYGGAFLSQKLRIPSTLFGAAFSSLKNNLIDKFALVPNKDILAIMRACGMNDLKIKLGDNGLQYTTTQSTNEYFHNKFIQPHLNAAISKMARYQDLKQYLIDQKSLINILSPESYDEVINHIEKYVIKTQLEQIDFKQLDTTYELFQYMNKPDNVVYQVGQVMQYDDVNKQTIPFRTLAKLYKAHLRSQYKITQFNQIVECFNEQFRYLNTLNNQQHMMIALYEFMEEHLSKQYFSEELVQCDDVVAVKHMINCSKESIDHFCQCLIMTIFNTVSPYRVAFNYKLQCDKLRLIVSHQDNRIQKHKLQEVLEYAKQAQEQSNNGLFLQYPQFNAQLIPIVQNVPQRLMAMLPQEIGKQYQVTTKGYAIVQWKSIYSLILNTLQLVTLVHLEEGNTQYADESTVADLQKVGLILDGKINEEWMPKQKTSVLWKQ